MARRFAIPLVIAVLSGLLLAVGCARTSAPKGQAGSPAATEEPMMARQEMDAGGAQPVPMAKQAPAAGGEQTKKPAAPVGAPADPAAVSASPAPPMIIYNATLDVIVKDL